MFVNMDFVGLITVWFDKYEWKLFDPGVNSATQKMWGNGKNLIWVNPWVCRV